MSNIPIKYYHFSDSKIKKLEKKKDQVTQKGQVRTLSKTDHLSDLIRSLPF
jgi:hypothetical protein